MAGAPDEELSSEAGVKISVSQPEVPLRVTRWASELDDKEVADLEAKIVQLDAEMVKEPTKKLTQRLQWFAGQRAVGGPSDGEVRSDEEDDEVSYEKPLTDSPMTTVGYRAKYTTSQTGATETLYVSPNRARRVRHNRIRWTMDIVRRIWRIVVPLVRRLIVCAYVGAFIWSCDVVIDQDFTAWAVLWRGLPAYLASCLLFAVALRGRSNFIANLTRLPRWRRNKHRWWGSRREQEVEAEALKSSLQNRKASAECTHMEPQTTQLPGTAQPILTAPITFPTEFHPQPHRDTRKNPERTGLLVAPPFDWQGLITTNPKPSSSVPAFTEEETAQVKSLRHHLGWHTYNSFLYAMRRSLRKIANHPSSVLSTVARNLIFCMIVFFTLSEASRPTNRDPWNYSTIPRELRIWDCALQWTLVSDHLLCFLAATSRLSFMFRFKTIVDLLTLPLLYKLVLFYQWPQRAPERLIFCVIRLLRLFRLESLVAYSIPSIEPVTLILGGLATDTAVILSSFASLMYLLEAPIPRSTFLNLGDFLYYAVVTMTTVGYGDYAPDTREGRWVTMAAIVTAFIVLPYQVQRLLTALHIPPTVVGHQPSTASSRGYIFLYGKIRPRQLGVMLHELSCCLPDAVYHVWVVTPYPAVSFKSLVSQFLREYGIKIGVSQKYPTTEEMQMYAGNARAVYVFGDPMCAPALTTTPSTAYSKMVTDDQKTFLRCAKVQPVCWPKVPLSVQLVHGMYSGLANELGAYNVVSLEMLKLRCLAKTVADCPGFIPLVFNWFQSPAPTGRVMLLLNQLQKRRKLFNTGGARNGISYENSSNQQGVAAAFVQAVATPFVDLKQTHHNGGRFTISDVPPVVPDEVNFYHYFSGLKYKAYRMDIPECFYGVDYSLIVRMLYRRFSVFLIGLASIDKKVYMNPVGHVMGCELGLYHLNHQGTKQRHNNRQVLALTGIVLATSIEVVEDIMSMTSLELAPEAIESEKQIVTQNLRTPLDLISATKTFFEDVRVTRLEVSQSTEDLLAVAGDVRRKGSDVSDASECRVRRVISAFSGLTPQPRRRLDLGSLNALCKRPSGLDHVTTSQLAPPPKEWPNSTKDGMLDNAAPVPTKRTKKATESDSSDDDASGVKEAAVIREYAKASQFLEHHPTQANFVLCCGWPKDLYTFLCVLDANPGLKCIFLSSHDAPGWGRWNRDLTFFAERCAWVHGSPLSVEDLKNAGALLASSIIIFSDTHAYYVPGEPSLNTTIDNQTILVRQQLYALFARVEDYLDSLRANTAKNRPATQLKLPLIITELQDRDSTEFLSNSKDLYLSRALRHVASKKEIGSIIPRTDEDRGDDLEWAREGGRLANYASAVNHSDGADGEVSGGPSDVDIVSSLKFQFNRTRLDSSAYVVQSEYRAGKVYFRELGYTLIGFGRPLSRFSVDVTLLEHAIDGCQSRVCDMLARVDLRNKRLQRYKWKSPVQLMPIPKILCNATFREAMNYCCKFQTKLPIGVLRRFSSSNQRPVRMDQGGPFDLFSAHSDEIVISCPSPTFKLIDGDKLYVLLPAPKHVLGLLRSEVYGEAQEAHVCADTPSY